MLDAKHTASFSYLFVEHLWRTSGTPDTGPDIAQSVSSKRRAECVRVLGADPPRQE